MKRITCELSICSLNKNLVENLWLADTFLSRFQGLQGRWSFPRGQGLILIPCQSIHTFWMNVPIDVLALSADGVIVDSRLALEPWRFWKPKSRCHAILELPAGTITPNDHTLTDDPAWLEGQIVSLKIPADFMAPHSLDFLRASESR